MHYNGCIIAVTVLCAYIYIYTHFVGPNYVNNLILGHADNVQFSEPTTGSRELKLKRGNCLKLMTISLRAF